jgi:hypothetical protein
MDLEPVHPQTCKRAEKLTLISVDGNKKVSRLKEGESVPNGELLYSYPVLGNGDYVRAKKAGGDSSFQKCNRMVRVVRPGSKMFYPQARTAN